MILRIRAWGDRTRLPEYVVGRGRQVGRLSLPRYFSTWSGHVQACVQG
jgi:hypothetical protein